MSTPTLSAFDLVAQAKQDLTAYNNDSAALKTTQDEIATLQTTAGTQADTVASDVTRVNTDLQAAAAALLALQIPTPAPKA